MDRLVIYSSYFLCASVVLEAIINAKPGLIQMRDNEGRNPLHFAASLGHLKAANYLLQNYPFNATRRDKKGKLPIHLAALEGHVDIICALHQDIPEADDLLDKSGRNILHIAARSGSYKVFNFALKNPNINSLVNMKDKFGDTPLHIACRNDHPKILNCLTWDQKIDFMAVNNKGMTALNVAYEKKACNPSFRQVCYKGWVDTENLYRYRIVNVCLFTLLFVSIAQLFYSVTTTFLIY